MKLGYLIRHKRETLGLTQKEFAKRAGISPQYYSSIEQGRYEPSSKYLPTIERELGVSIEFLISKYGGMFRADQPPSTIPLSEYKKVIIEITNAEIKIKQLESEIYLLKEAFEISKHKSNRLNKTIDELQTQLK